MHPIPILSVDDDENDRFFFRRAFATLTIPTAVTIMNDGLQAIEHLTACRHFPDPVLNRLPNLIMTDLKMPMVSGIGLVRWIRQQPAFAQIPIVVMSSSSHQSDIRACRDVGANAYAVKSTEPRHLADFLSEVLTYCGENHFQAEGWLPIIGNEQIHGSSEGPAHLAGSLLTEAAPSHSQRFVED
jgi:CheY-like chemotaxis protein